MSNTNQDSDNTAQRISPEALEILRVELTTHGKTCLCVTKKMCEDREEWLLKVTNTAQVAEGEK